MAFRPLRLSLICIVLAALATVGTALLGHALVGIFFGIGLGMGLLNALLVRRSVHSITAQAHPLKSKMALNSATRLMFLTVIGLVVAFVFRPEGLGVVFGMALFQMLLVFTTALPVARKLRAGGLDGSEGEATTQ